MLKIQLFGTGQASYYNRSLVGFPHQQPCLLFCYLLLNRRHPIRREYLASIFWGDFSTQTSRNNLRKTIYRLRVILQSAGICPDDYLFITENNISFISSSNYWLDIELFDFLINQCLDVHGEALSPEQATNLSKAVELYGGDLLDSIYEDWCMHERERLRLAYLTALGKLLEYHRYHGNFEKGLAYGENILSQDNTRESVHREMMQLYALIGDRAGASAQYKRCCQILKEELGIAPMPETRLMYEQILHQKTFSQASIPSYSDGANAIDNMSSARYALQTLQHLQKMVSETSKELQHLESLINQVMLHPESGETPPS
jgi:DNA-binding SARP family transcriptional activator